MKRIILVKGDMRSGTNLVVDHFVNYGYQRSNTGDTDIGKINEDVPTVIHDHKVNYLPKKIKKTFLFLVLRRDILAQALSQLLFEKMKSSLREDEIESIGNVFYPKSYIPIDPFEIDVDHLLRRIVRINNNNKLRSKTILNSKVDFEIVYFEDFVNDPARHFRRYTKHLNSVQNPFFHKATPYQSKNLVKNYDVLVDWWNKEKYKYSLFQPENFLKSAIRAKMSKEFMDILS